MKEAQRSAGFLECKQKPSFHLRRVSQIFLHGGTLKYGSLSHSILNSCYCQVRKCVRVYIYMYIYIYTHTHTHTHIYIYIYGVGYNRVLGKLLMNTIGGSSNAECSFA